MQIIGSIIKAVLHSTFNHFPEPEYFIPRPKCPYLGFLIEKWTEKLIVFIDSGTNCCSLQGRDKPPICTMIRNGAMADIGECPIVRHWSVGECFGDDIELRAEFHPAEFSPQGLTYGQWSSYLGYYHNPGSYHPELTPLSLSLLGLVNVLDHLTAKREGIAVLWHAANNK